MTLGELLDDIEGKLATGQYNRSDILLVEDEDQMDIGEVVDTRNLGYGYIAITTTQED